jgi:hypothetical protein
MLATLLFGSPRSLWIALAIAAAIFTVALFRRIQIGRISAGLLALGILLLALAAGQPLWSHAGEPSILVMVDLSPSTRGAMFRDRSSLDARVHQLLGDQPARMLAFSDDLADLPSGTSLPDLPAGQTRFSPPLADAILLFSDGQFELPAYAPPTYPVVDPALDHPADAAVTELKMLDSHALATVRNSAGPKRLYWTGAVTADSTARVGNFWQSATPTGPGQITAFLPRGDLWPENDSLTIAQPPPTEKQKWWIGESPPPPGWRGISPAAFPADSAELLQASVIALGDVAADSLSFEQQVHLQQYVRDLGGSLVIVGGPHAFAAGRYGNTLLDELSPLASDPPMPTMQWLLLIDGSGSMAGEPWKIQVDALTRLLPQLPAADGVSIGSFAQSLSWWSTGKSAAETSRLRFPPANVGPRGPTNLAATLDQIADQTDGSVLAELLLMTDADAELPHPAELAAAMKARKIHLHLLALGQGSALEALRSVADATGGSVLVELNPQQWISSANLLLRSAMPDHYQHREITPTPAPPASISQWNQTWLKTDATAIQTSPEAPIVARWRRGLGQVTAIAYPADQAQIERFAEQIQQPPGDPRFAVSCETGPTLRIKVDAIDHDRFMNGLPITLDLFDPRGTAAAATAMNIPQTGPGEYQLSLPAPRSPRLMTVRTGDHILSRFSVAGRYAPEFDAIGNNMENLRLLADRTGGTVIPPGPVKPLKFTGPITRFSLTAAFAFAGFIAIAGGMIGHQKRK